MPLYPLFDKGSEKETRLEPVSKFGRLHFGVSACISVLLFLDLPSVNHRQSALNCKRILKQNGAMKKFVGKMKNGNGSISLLPQKPSHGVRPREKAFGAVMPVKSASRLIVLY